MKPTAQDQTPRRYDTNNSGEEYGVRLALGRRAPGGPGRVPAHGHGGRFRGIIDWMNGSCRGFRFGVIFLEVRGDGPG